MNLNTKQLWDEFRLYCSCILNYRPFKKGLSKSIQNFIEFYWNRNYFETFWFKLIQLMLWRDNTKQFSSCIWAVKIKISAAMLLQWIEDSLNQDNESKILVLSLLISRHLAKCLMLTQAQSFVLVMHQRCISLSYCCLITSTYMCLYHNTSALHAHNIKAIL